MNEHCSKGTSLSLLMCFKSQVGMWRGQSVLGKKIRERTQTRVGANWDQRPPDGAGESDE